jgi:hypothetical protein
MVKIHNKRFDEFVTLRQRYDKQREDGVISVKYTNKIPKDKPIEVRVGIFRRIWNNIFG